MMKVIWLENIFSTQTWLRMMNNLMFMNLKFFEIVQNVKLFEFLRPSCIMVLGVQNLLWICGSHQNIIMMMWLIKLTNCSYEFEALRTGMTI